MITFLICSVVYFVGLYLAFAMLRAEHSSSGETYTKGDRVFAITLSLLSFTTVLYLLVAAWFRNINTTGYWDEPVDPVKPEEEFE